MAALLVPRNLPTPRDYNARRGLANIRLTPLQASASRNFFRQPTTFSATWPRLRAGCQALAIPEKLVPVIVRDPLQSAIVVVDRCGSDLRNFVRTGGGAHAARPNGLRERDEFRLPVKPAVIAGNAYTHPSSTPTLSSARCGPSQSRPQMPDSDGKSRPRLRAAWFSWLASRQVGPRMLCGQRQNR